MKRLLTLLEQEHKGLRPWVAGNIPKHFKRLSVSKEKAEELAIYGASVLGTYYQPKEGFDGFRPYYCQALMAGAILSGEYDNITIATPAQYGKSTLLGHVGLIKAHRGDRTYIAGADAGVTEIIMDNVIGAVQEAIPDVQMALEGVKKNDLNRLSTALNKKHIKFPESGEVETISLGESYAGLRGNRAIGRGGDYMVDEAANISDEALSELGRADFANVDGSKCQIIMISNPHSSGEFYDRLTEENPDERTFILWIDILTAVEEGRTTKERVLESRFAKNKDTRTRYLLCELPESGQGMFDEPVVDDSIGDTYFLGVDSAYKGKDNISLCLISVDTKVHVEEILVLDKSNWIDGVTSKDIIKQISMICGKFKVQKICVDVGQGIWLTEGLKELGLPVEGINFSSSPTESRRKAYHYEATNAVNVRAEMHLTLQSMIEHNRITFMPDAYELVKKEMNLVSADRKSNGKIQIRPKPEIKMLLGKSPDELDSVLLAIHAFVLWTGGYEEYIGYEEDSA